MLKTVWLREKPNTNAGCVMLLGGFDGLHRGHKKLVERAKTYALPVGIMTIVGGKETESLFTLGERELLFRESGIDFVFELPFAEIKDMSPEAFVGRLQREFLPKAFVCGDDFRFGSKAAGTPETLKRSTHVSVDVVELVKMDGKKIGSSQIKTLLATGEIERANALLEENFFLAGEVKQDRKIGRTLGFPTANIAYPKDKFPLKKGVYETCVCLNGKTYRGITNFGARPTFENDTVVTETYLDGFAGDLYGKTLKVEFVRFLREIRKFKSTDELKKQLEYDIGRVRRHD